MIDAPNVEGPALPGVAGAVITEQGPTREGRLYTHPEILRVFHDGIQPAMRARGYSVTIASGARTLQEQQHDYQLYRAGKGGRAAPPGRSAHNYGLAIDCLVAPPNGYRGDAWGWANSAAGRKAYQLLHKIARHYGLEDIAAAAPDDPFHLQAPNWRKLAGI